MLSRKFVQKTKYFSNKFLYEEKILIETTFKLLEYRFVNFHYEIVFKTYNRNNKVTMTIKEY